MLTDASSAKPGYRSRVERAVGAHERRGRQLVEHDDDDRARSAGTVDVTHVAGGTTGDQLRRRAEEEERAEEEQVRDGEVGDEQLRAPRAEHEHGHADADAAAPTRATRMIWSSPNVRSRASPNAVARAATTTTNTIVPAAPVTNVASSRRADADERRDERDQQGEPHDLGPAVVAGDEELRVLSEQVEQRLGHRQPAQTRG